MRRNGHIAGLLLLGLLLLPATVHAATEESQNRGLYIAPVRQYVDAIPATTVEKQLTIANITEAPLRVTLSVQEFAVADYSYDFLFKPAQKDWVRLGQTLVELEPGKSKTVDYTVTPPADAAAGGHYFTLFAAATLQSGNITSQVRAATSLYVTVQGGLDVSSTIQNVQLPRFSMGDFPFTLDVRNTGNTHFFTYVSGELKGLSARGKGPEVTNLLLPNTVRRISSTLPAPLLPGLYEAHFGYTTDRGQSVERTEKVFYLPWWSVCMAAGVVWLGLTFNSRRLRKRGSWVARNDRVGHG